MTEYIEYIMKIARNISTYGWFLTNKIIRVCECMYTYH